VKLYGHEYMPAQNGQHYGSLVHCLCLAGSDWPMSVGHAASSVSFIWCFADAQVKVLFKGSSAAAGRVTGDLAAEGVTAADGSFSLGPLYDDVSGGYSVELLKPGHVFTADGEADGQLLFRSKQLAQVGGGG